MIVVSTSPVDSNQAERGQEVEKNNKIVSKKQKKCQHSHENGQHGHGNGHGHSHAKASSGKKSVVAKSKPSKKRCHILC